MGLIILGVNMRVWLIAVLMFMMVGCASQPGPLATSSSTDNRPEHEGAPLWLVESKAIDNEKVNCNLTPVKDNCQLQTIQKHSPMVVKPVNAREMVKVTATKGPLRQTVGKNKKDQNEKLPVQAAVPRTYQSLDSLAMAPDLAPEDPVQEGVFPEFSRGTVGEEVMVEEDVVEPAPRAEKPVMEMAARAESPEAPRPAVTPEKPASEVISRAVTPKPDAVVEARAAEDIEPLAVDPSLLAEADSAPAAEQAAKENENPKAVTVASGETLMAIAGRIQPEAAKRAAVALWMDNKEQFIDGNMNGILAGRVLSLGNLEKRLAEVDDKTARATLKEQWTEWTARNKPAPVAAVEEKPSENSEDAAEASAQAPAEDEGQANEAEPVASAASENDTEPAGNAASEQEGEEEPVARVTGDVASESDSAAVPVAHTADEEPAKPEAAAVPEKPAQEEPRAEAAPQAGEPVKTALSEPASAEAAKQQASAPAPKGNTFTRTMDNLQNKVTRVAENIWGSGFNKFVARVRGNALVNKEP